MATPRIAEEDGSDVLSYNVGNGVGARFDSQGRRRAGTTAAPVATAGAGAGASPTISNAGTDEHGSVSVTTGASGSGAGTLATVPFAVPFAAAPVAVLITPADTNSASLSPYASATASTLTIGVHNAPVASTAYKFFYQVVGG